MITSSEYKLNFTLGFTVLTIFALMPTGSPLIPSSNVALTRMIDASEHPWERFSSLTYATSTAPETEFVNEKIIFDFAEKFLANSKDLDEKFLQILENNFEKLLA